MSKSKKRSNPEPVSQPASITSEVPVKKSKNASPFSEVKSVEDALKGLKKVLQGIEEHKGLSLKQVQDWCKESGIDIPWPTMQAPSKGFCESESAKELLFDFEAPKSIAIAGSFMLQSSLSQEDSNVDMIVEQPEGVIFRYADGAKDHINWRYWLRRTFYLTVCYDALKKSLPESSVSLAFDYLNGNPYKSIIVIKFAGIDRVIRIIPSVPFSETFKSKMFRLAPTRSNVRPSWLQSWIHGTAANFEANAKELPTPFYNYSLLSEALYLPHLIHLHAVLKGSPVLAAALKMIKAWLKQSGVSPVTSINGFTASMWLVDMVNSGIINPSIMDELQIFKLVLKSWIDAFESERSEFAKKLSGFDGDYEGFSSETPGPLCLLAGPMNLFYAANFNSLQGLAQLASSTLIFLANHPDRLDRIFLTKLGCELFTQDLVVEYKNVQSVSGLPAGVVENYANVLSSGYLEGRISLVLRKGLTDRFKGPLNIQVTKSKINYAAFDIKIGLTFDTQNFERSLDLGPNSDEKETAAKFRGFWGSKSELRQFKDSAIRECVAWETVKDKTTIPKEIITWLMSRHFGLGKSSSDTSQKLAFFNETSSLNAFTKFSGAFDALGRELRGLNQVLPLTIVQCVGISPAHRHTSLKVPEARDTLDHEFPCSVLPSPSCPVYDFLIKFERSAAWPDERQALQSARQAFLLQLNRTLQSRKIVQASLVASEYIDIYYNGYVFRGWIEVPREELRCRAEGLIAEAERIERRTFWQPRLSNTLHQISTRQKAFGETCQLIKTFLSGHLIAIDDDLIDSMVALIFLKGEDQKGSGKASWVGSLLQNRPSGTALTGFLRFLDLLINFPWNERPLILDFTSFEVVDEQQMSQVEVDAMNSSDWSALIRQSSSTTAVSIIPIFSMEQKAMILNGLGNPDLMALIPALPIDTIERITLIRCKLLARLTLEHLEAENNNQCSDTLQGLFKMSAEAIGNDFDILIKLDGEQLQQIQDHRIEGITRIMRNAPQPCPLLFSLLPGFSVVERLLKDLSGPLKALNSQISFNPLNPAMLAVRVKSADKLDQVAETVKRIGGDLIKDMKITSKLQ